MKSKRYWPFPHGRPQQSGSGGCNGEMDAGKGFVEVKVEGYQ